ncbi:pilus assembly protein N-terminal domain-containing protein [Sphingomonas cannabina]|uniref:type II and III secretion system protein family protein n=1 Tax=Sphingomonas cannabina TaxID=2899123 RepID=UPI001F3599FA|nr:pilus assembly protein N-terminal domain-containing protein [Sphingomonas cannabina]UIJ44547.1 pilus assembly protein N-terminal domain-containing protein [Sphingomonas cannabina]
MHRKTFLRRSLAATVATALVAGTAATARPGPAERAGPARVAKFPAGAQRPTTEVTLSVGQGELVNLPASVASVWTSNPAVADVFVNNPRQIHLFGKEFGEATVFATAANGSVVYATNVRVSQNITSIDRMMKLAMPDADVKVTTVGQIAVLTGTVASPDDSAEAQRLVTALLNPGVNVNSPDAQLKIGVVNRLRTATPLQVNLQVRIAEVSRSFVKNIGVNMTTFDPTGGFKFGIGQGRKIFNQYAPGGPLGVGDEASNGVTSVIKSPNGTSLFGNGKLFGMDVLGGLDLGEQLGQVTTLANPNLTALSGETATFLAGGEVPILISQPLGGVTVEYKQYGVSLAYTPTVLSDGRISLRVRPEVSELSAAGAIVVGNTQIPAMTTRRTETTVELGSGESLVIGGLLSNRHDNGFDKTPGVGDLPILGALFRSNSFKRNESELVIVVTPYLVKPVNANEIALPTDGYKAPTDLGRIFMGELASGQSGASRPKPSMATPSAPSPSIGAVAPLTPAPVAPQRQETAPAPEPRKVKKDAGAMPGFSFR